MLKKLILLICMLFYFSIDASAEPLVYRKLKLNSLGDVTVTTPSNDQLLKYNSTSLDWENWTPNFLTDITGEAFIDLSDTPANYTGAGGYLVRVNATPDGLEFVDGNTLFDNRYLKLNQTTPQTISNGAPIFSTGIDLSDDAYIGLGAAKGRIVFDDLATDELQIKSSNLVVDNGIGIEVSPTTAKPFYISKTWNSGDANTPIKVEATHSGSTMGNAMHGISVDVEATNNAYCAGLLFNATGGGVVRGISGQATGSGTAGIHGIWAQATQSSSGYATGLLSQASASTGAATGITVNASSTTASDVIGLKITAANNSGAGTGYGIYVSGIMDYAAYFEDDIYIVNNLTDGTNSLTVANIKSAYDRTHGITFGITPSSDPTTDYQFANKKYVDDQMAGVNEFTELTDTPANYTGAGLKVVRVNTGATALEFLDISTSEVDEGTNLYYTDARARAALSNSNPISYNSGTGVIGLNYDTAFFQLSGIII